MRVKRMLGKGVIYDPDAIVYHKVPRSKLGASALLRRAFYQGYSKALLHHLNVSADPMATERSYLKALLLKHIPLRMKRIYDLTEMKKLSVLIASIFSVGLGFLYGYARGGHIAKWKRR